MNKKIADKIAKMMALSENNGNEGDTALQMAEKLMDEYGITYKQIEESRLEDELGSIGESCCNPKGNIKGWELNLAQVIAMHFDCLSVIRKYRNADTNWRFKSIMMFVGHESNRITAQCMFEWLKKELRKEARKNVENKAMIDSYCFGAVKALYEKYHTEKPACSGLVVISAVQRYVNDVLNAVEGKSRKVSVYKKASREGAEYGKGISLNRQCNSEKGIKLIAD